MSINTQLNDMLSAVVGEEIKKQLKEDIGTAMLQRATGMQKAQRIKANVCREVKPRDPEEEDRRYIRSMCTSSRRTFARL